VGHVFCSAMSGARLQADGLAGVGYLYGVGRILRSRIL
jgi:hypothetical protein